MWDQGYSAEGYKASQKGRTWTNRAFIPFPWAVWAMVWKFSAKACWVCSAVCKEK